MQVELPASLTERQQLIVHRRASIEAGSEYNPTELRRSLVTEIMEKIARSNSDLPIVTLNDIMDAYLADQGTSPLPPVTPPPPTVAPQEPPTLGGPPTASAEDSNKTKKRTESRFKLFFNCRGGTRTFPLGAGGSRHGGDTMQASLPSVLRTLHEKLHFRVIGPRTLRQLTAFEVDLSDWALRLTDRTPCFWIHEPEHLNLPALELADQIRDAVRQARAGKMKPCSY